MGEVTIEHKNEDIGYITVSSVAIYNDNGVSTLFLINNRTMEHYSCHIVNPDIYCVGEPIYGELLDSIIFKGTVIPVDNRSTILNMYAELVKSNEVYRERYNSHKFKNNTGIYIVDKTNKGIANYMNMCVTLTDLDGEPTMCLYLGEIDHELYKVSIINEEVVLEPISVGRYNNGSIILNSGLKVTNYTVYNITTIMEFAQLVYKENIPMYVGSKKY